MHKSPKRQTESTRSKRTLMPMALVFGFAFILSMLATQQPASAAVPSPTTSCSVQLDNGVPTLRWTGGNGATAFIIYRNRGVRARATGTSFSDGRVANGTTYDYSITPTNGDGNGANRYCGRVTTPGGGSGGSNVSAPSSCSLTPIFRKEVRVTWTGGDGANFVIRRNTGWLGRTDGSARSFDDLRAEHGRRYVYTIEATRGGSVSARTVCGTIDIPPPGNSWNRPQSPVSCTVTRSGGANVITWTSVPGTYIILRRNGGWRGRIDSGNSFTDNRLAQGVNYTYTVEARNGAGFSNPTQCR